MKSRSFGRLTLRYPTRSCPRNMQIFLMNVSKYSLGSTSSVISGLKGRSSRMILNWSLSCYVSKFLNKISDHSHTLCINIVLHTPFVLVSTLFSSPLEIGLKISHLVTSRMAKCYSFHITLLLHFIHASLKENTSSKLLQIQLPS